MPPATHCKRLVLALVLIGCPPPPVVSKPDAGSSESAAKGSVALAIGESAEAGGLTVTFTGVDGDNRCPKSVQCIVGGQAGVLLTVEDSSGGSEELRIAVPPDGTGSGRYGEFEFVVDLEPETRASEPIDPDAYIATVTVSDGPRGES